ncbi:hypothetical protein TI39_contig312g00032 [Zymoseptoria brevis]|uniref:Uncharacterized protein n=1 Tax=Zymoseptoria brevis TaxID=1047168 RepID=A0A0F4GTQ4_9PEZI|nr:hypothetical protein TI39_contig312g00032 [Zymoseptoria brevis]
MPPGKMAPRKEPKETVVYPANKRKAPPFKPLRPSKTSRTGDGESSTAASVSKPSKSKPAVTRKPATMPITLDIPDSDDDDQDDDIEDFETGTAGASRKRKNSLDDSDDDLPTNPPLRKKQAPSRPPTTTTRLLSSSPPTLPPASPTPSTALPQPLLLRLLHSSFTSPNTQIDTHATGVLSTYLEIFIRETLARAKLGKEEAVEAGEVEKGDEGWLERTDLERVAGGLMCDF